MDHLEIRTEALAVRREIEHIATHLWSGFTVTPTPRSASIPHRLMLTAARQKPELRHQAARAARRVAEIYVETSDVLHGRTRSAQFTTRRIADWRHDLARLRYHLTEPSQSTTARDEHIDARVTP